MMQAKARIVNCNRNCSFIVLATVIAIVNYDRHLFIVQATGGSMGPKYVLQLLLSEKSQNC